MNQEKQKELPKRKPLRLKAWDYSTPWWYYVTICTQGMKQFFGRVVGATRGSPASVELNENGKVVESIWHTLPDHHLVELDAFQIMPNHLHGIIIVTGDSPRTSATAGVGARRASPEPNEAGQARLTPTKLGTIVGSFKSECTKQIRRTLGDTDVPIWQRNYYEHIIRNEKDLERIRHYINTNVAKWDEDEYNPENPKGSA